MSNIDQWQRAHLSPGRANAALLFTVAKESRRVVSAAPMQPLLGSLSACRQLRGISFIYFRDCAFAVIFSKLVDVTTVNLQQIFPVLWTLFHTAGVFCQNV